MRACAWYAQGRRFNPARRLRVSEVLTVARGPAKAAGRVRSPSLTPSPSSPTGRGAWFRARRFPVRIRGGALKEHWPSGYGSALLRRTSGNRCEGSSPSCSARGWLADLVRRPAGKPVTARAVGRFESCAIRSRKGKPSVGRRQRFRKPPSPAMGLVGPSPTPSALDAQSDWRRSRF